MGIQKKKIYEKPDFEVCAFNGSDIVTSSGAGAKEAGSEWAFEIPGDNIWG